MGGEIREVGGGHRKVEPINWTEKTDLNQRRVAHEQPKKVGGGGINETDHVTFSDDIYQPRREVSAPSGRGETRLVPATSGRGETRLGESRSVQHVKQTPAPEIASTSTATKTEATTPKVELAKPNPEVAQAPNGPKPMNQWSNADLANRKYQLSVSGMANQADCVELVQLQEELVRRGGRGTVMAETPRVEVKATNTVAPVENASPIESVPGKGFSSTLGRAVGGGFAFLGIVGGGMQVGAGIDMMKNGQFLDGSVTTLSGFSNTAAGTAALWMNNPVAGTFAMRAGGAGAVLDGGLNLYNGYQRGDQAQMLDGGVKTGLGATMLYGGTAGLYAGSAYAGWSVGRFIGGTSTGDGKTVDDHVTEFFYNALFAS
jgi:hypothetical protein